jgi:hypothetical protein
MIRHIVLFKLKPGVRKEQVRELIAALERLPALIPEVRGYEVRQGVPGRPGNYYDLILLSDFDDVSAVDRYRAHPEHEKVLQLIDQLVASRSVIDYEY